MRILAFIVMVAAFILTGCSKENTSGESDLYGTWVKGSNFGDTIQFMRKNNKNIMRYGIPVYEEYEYVFKNGKLSIKRYMPLSPDYFHVSSFTWVQPGNEFKIQGIQLYMFMSSTVTYFTYRKI